ncbi:hypothetical protein ACFX2J_004306 [Malus domestica]
MEEGKQEKRIKHYSSSQSILLVGEGDFSFAACLAKKFGSAASMIATSLDSKELLFSKYLCAKSNVKELEDRDCLVLHDVDVHTMSLHPLLIHKLFDRIVFNFPHAGFFLREHKKYQIELHQNLVRNYFKSAHKMLANCGEIHVTHKTAYPFNEWKIVELAEEFGLHLVEEAEFSLCDYPGYLNRRGSGIKCSMEFPVGKCSTFNFAKQSANNDP